MGHFGGHFGGHFDVPRDEQNKALMKILNERLAKGDIDESQLKNLKKTLGV